MHLSQGFRFRSIIIIIMVCTIYIVIGETLLKLLAVGRKFLRSCGDAYCIC